MEQYIPKSALVAEIEKLISEIYEGQSFDSLSREKQVALWYVKSIMPSIDTIEVKDPYEQCIQYPSVKDGIKAHAETYSFNIESELFNQLTKEQQKLWRKEIEQAAISGGEAGVELAKDPRYKENLEVKEVDLEKIINDYFKDWKFDDELDIMIKPNNYSASFTDLKYIAKHFFELGLKAQKGEEV